MERYLPLQYYTPTDVPGCDKLRLWMHDVLEITIFINCVIFFNNYAHELTF